MATTVDEFLTLYTAKDLHTPVANRVAQAQMQVGRGLVDTTRLRQNAEKVLAQETKALERSLKLQQQVAKTSREESNERAAAARAVTAETRARDALTRSLEREARATHQVSAARKFAQGFGSTRLNFGAASPLVSSFTRGGLAGGAGALTATALGGLMSGGSALMSGLGNMLQNGVQGGLGMLGDLAVRAQEAAMGASSRQGRLTAILKDSQMAAQVLKTVQATAAPSTATTKQLAEAATTLEAFGVNANRTIPLIGKLATAMGAGEEQMQMYARAIGQLGTGNMIDADVMAAMGLQRRDFAQQGIQFDGNGKLLSTAEQALTALERIVNDRFGNIFEQMANTPEAKRASLEDAGERALAIIGDGMLRTQGPLVDALTKSLNAAVDSGALAEVTSKITKALMGGLGGDASNPIMRIMANTLSVVNNLPEAIGRTFKFLDSLFSTIFENISVAGKFAYDTIAAIWKIIGAPAPTPAQGASGGPSSGGGGFLDKLLTGHKGVARGGLLGDFDAKGIWDFVQKMMGYTPGVMAANGISSFAKSQFGMQGGLIPGLPALPQFKSLPSFNDPRFGTGVDLMKDSDRFYAMLTKAAQAGTPGIPDATGQKFLRRPMDDGSVLDSIKKATERTAKNTDGLDLREAIFGGGAKARRGISFADVMGGPSRGGGSVTVKADKAADKIREALYDVIEETLPDLLDVVTRKMAFQ